MDAREKFLTALKMAMRVSGGYGRKRYAERNVDALASLMLERFLEHNSWYSVMGLACELCGIQARARSVRLYLFSDIAKDQEFRELPSPREMQIRDL